MDMNMDDFLSHDLIFGEDTSFDLPQTAEPVWILGRSYSALYDLEELKSDVRTRFWFSYRKNFPPIGGTSFTTDTGWGCMLRCGQMMLAQALVLQTLGREWRWVEGAVREQAYNSILARFLDHKRSCYSVHLIALMGESEGKKLGEWFGPNTVAQVLKKLSFYDEISKLAIHIAMDNLLIVEEVQQACKNSSGFWTPLLLFIPLRLGLTEMNPAYIRALKCCLSMRESVGIIGGKPNHAYYFIGFVEDELLYLDPHKTQSAPNLNFTSQMEIQDIVDAVKSIPDESYHCNMVNRMDFSLIDPSVALGFYCHTEGQFENLCKILRSTVLDKQPMLFELCEKAPAGWDGIKTVKVPSSVSVSGDSGVRSNNGKSKRGAYDYESETDSDYELLG
ncbi:cysteine protease ATG4B-like [Paramacrobiotus metropolitanus]|uniref:cysteine protease ATG4B-like n=1 Tax=Paramacrobiotus metropolitanus TaxID=2943436 RepID=UPI0024463DDF|nr:cysteine protease ATG4B-like [Paramacrobiotus metropolitanus]